MIPQINVLSVVDVIGALATGSLNNKLFMVDNHPANQDPTAAFRPAARKGRQGISSGVPSLGLGTDSLITGATYGQVFNWHVMGIDFQTNIQIENIVFFRYGRPITVAGTPCLALRRYGAPSGEYWAGIINLEGVIQAGEYQYLIGFNLNGKQMMMENFATLIVN